MPIEASTTCAHVSREQIRQELIATLSSFEALFPTEETAIDELYRRLLVGGVLACRYCGASEFHKSNGSRRARCINCRKIIWITAGTFLHKMKRLKPLLALIWLMEHGCTITSSMVHNLLGLAQSSTLMLLHKIRMAVCQKAEILAEVPIGCFAAAVSKRSRETPAGQHPETELQNDLQPYSEPIDETKLHAPRAASGLPVPEVAHTTEEFTGTEQKILALLGDRPISIDWLFEKTRCPLGDLAAGLVTLELWQKAIRLPGDLYIGYQTNHRKPPSPLSCQQLPQELTDLIRRICRLAKAVFRGVSGKHLQGYLLACSFTEGPESLLDVCLKIGTPVTYRQILEYVSPRQIAIYR